VLKVKERELDLNRKENAKGAKERKKTQKETNPTMSMKISFAAFADFRALCVCNSV
jgi:hypothetical protein